ncbi:MAG: hypothetical protein L3K19_03025 [Thermoplasmata archaeon]|nr:hypothetical protein [Thermoplasmata archaeon]
MLGKRVSRVLGYTALSIAIIASTGGFLAAPAAPAAPNALGQLVGHAGGHGAPPATLPQSTFVSGPPAWAKGPDDITHLALRGLDHGRDVIYTAYQNGVNPNGTPGSPGGPTYSTVVGYDRISGAIVRTLNVTGKVDGLSADRWMGTLIATVNEDDHSGLLLIDPATGGVATYTYSPDPAVSGNGGTDSIAVRAGVIYVAHSNPNDTTQATDYLVTLHRSTLVAQLTPVFFDDSSALNVLTHSTVSLALTDPDTNFIMPASSPRFAGELATIGQADGQIVFASHLGNHPLLHVLPVLDNRSGNIPPLDGMAVATCSAGTLYVVDAKANTLLALNTTGWPAGTVFVGEPSDNGNPLVGTLNLLTGNITPLGNHFVSPKGLLFIADYFGGCGLGGHDGDRTHGASHGEGARGRGERGSDRRSAD